MQSTGIKGLKMNLTVRISFRNLLRQKTRNILLGIGIGFCMMIMVVAHSFSQGMSDTILNKMMADILGHVTIASLENTNNRGQTPMIRDKHDMMDIINNTLDNVKEVKESIVAQAIQAVGNNASTVMALFGVSVDADTFLKKLEIVEGDINSFKDKAIENPLILFSQKADELNVKVGDVVKIRLETIYGQAQSARLNLVAIVESKNPFLDTASILPMSSVKALLGYRPYETPKLLIIFNKLKDPKITLAKADQLHKALRAKPAVIFGTFMHNDYSAKGTTLAVQTDQKAIDLFSEQITPVKGSFGNPAKDRGKIMIGRSLADNLHAKIGDIVTLRYETRFEGISPEFSYEIASIIKGKKIEYDNIAILNEPDLQDIYFDYLPKKTDSFPDAFVPAIDDPIRPAIALTHTLVDRTENFEQLVKKRQKQRRTRWRGNQIDVVSMEEFAAEQIKLEKTLSLINAITVLILFFILLIGVVNTLRMTVKERTREIGTIRAIGMQRSQVSLSFLMETVFLSFFASIAGIISAFIVMHLLTFLTFTPDNLINIFLDDGHPYFLPNLQIISIDMALIILLAVIAAYFPAQKAANLSITKSLGHYE
jgi:putative ABC transport system permease protein